MGFKEHYDKWIEGGSKEAFFRILRGAPKDLFGGPGPLGPILPEFKGVEDAKIAKIKNEIKGIRVLEGDAKDEKEILLLEPVKTPAILARIKVLSAEIRKHESEISDREEEIRDLKAKKNKP